MQNKPNNPFYELLINIILPILILNKGGEHLGEHGPTKALIIALSFPLLYALYDFKKNNHKNLISILGFVGLLISGGFGLLQMDGKWFTLKEAGIPFLIGLFVLASAFSKKPIFKMMILNDRIIKVDLLKEALEKKGTTQAFENHLKTSTIFFSGSFFMSALLNYILAIRVFKEISLELPNIERQEILNQQIAEMTWLGYVVILVPSIVIMSAILWHLFKGIKQFTGLPFTEVMRDE